MVCKLLFHHRRCFCEAPISCLVCQYVIVKWWRMICFAEHPSISRNRISHSLETCMAFFLWQQSCLVKNVSSHTYKVLRILLLRYSCLSVFLSDISLPTCTTTTLFYNTMSTITTLPIVVKHNIWRHLLPKIGTIEIGQPLPFTPVTINECLAPFSHTNKTLRDEIITWYTGIKQTCNYTHTSKFGAINLDQVTFTLTAFNPGDHHGCGCWDDYGDPGSRCDDLSCIFRVCSYVHPVSPRDIDCVRSLKLMLIGWSYSDQIQVWTCRLRAGWKASFVI